MDLFIDGRLPAGRTRNLEPFNQWFDGQALQCHMVVVNDHDGDRKCDGWVFYSPT